MSPHVGGDFRVGRVKGASEKALLQLRAYVPQCMVREKCGNTASYGELSFCSCKLYAGGERS